MDPNNFHIFRMDRLNEFESRGGGVINGIRCGIKCERIDVPRITGIDHVFIKLLLNL